MSRELGDKDLGSGMSLMLDLILNRPCLVSPFLCFVCSFGAVTSLSEDREMGKASDGWSTSCSMSVIKSGGNQGKKALSFFFFQRAYIESSLPKNVFCNKKSGYADSKALEEVDSPTLSHGAVHFTPTQSRKQQKLVVLVNYI